MSWVTDKLNDLSTKMNYTLHDELTENGTDISEIVTENEATPDISVLAGVLIRISCSMRDSFVTWFSPQINGSIF
jgi:hypothetical protein